MAEPLGSLNITQSLFYLDEKLMTKNKTPNNDLYNSTMVSDWNSLNSVQGIDNQFPVFMNQSKISTWYQDNGSAPILLFSNQFGLPTMGGQYKNVGTGSRPGNTVKDVPKPGYALFSGNQYAKIEEPTPVSKNFNITMNNGIALPSFMDPLSVKNTYGL
jgi:hypothetical protein